MLNFQSFIEDIHLTKSCKDVIIEYVIPSRNLKSFNIAIPNPDGFLAKSVGVTFSVIALQTIPLSARGGF